MPAEPDLEGTAVSLQPAAAGAELGSPGLELQEGVCAVQGLQEEPVGGAGSDGRYLAAAAPESPHKEEMADVCRAVAHVEPSSVMDLLGKTEESVGRTSCQRNVAR